MKYLKNPRIFALFFALFIGLIITWATWYMGDTTSNTANGIWKIWVLKLNMEGKPIFNLNQPLYDDTMVFLLKNTGLLNLSGTMSIKMALINSVFAGFAIFFLWLTLWEITRKFSISSLIAVGFAFSGFFFIDATNSEDIMPAFSFFIISIYFLVKYFYSRLIRNVIISSIFFTLSTLHHRTIIMAFPAFIFALLYHSDFLNYLIKSIKKKKFSLKNFYKKIFSTILFMFIFSVIIFCLFVYFKKPPSAFLMPYTNNGWVGFSKEKIIFSVVSGIGQSQQFGRNLGSIPKILSINNLIFEIPTLILVFYLAYKLLKILSPFSLFLLINFLVTEFINLRTQGQDPQFQLPALVIIPFGLAIAYKRSFNKELNIIKFIIIFVAIINIVTTIYTAKSRIGYDNRQIAYFKNLEKLFDPKNTAFLNLSSDHFTTWGRVVWDIDYWGHFLSFHGYFIHNKDFTGEQMGQRLLEDIENMRKVKKRIIVTSISKDRFTDEALIEHFARVDSQQRAPIIKKILLQKYSFKFLTNSEYGPLYELVPKDQYLVSDL